MEEYVVNEMNGFDHYNSLKDVTLIKIDRNGTHYYTDYNCPKCGGTGYINYYSHVDGGVCFLCGGSGRHAHNFLVRTKEYNTKLIQQRLERARKTAGERNAKYLHMMGFSEDGRAWLVMGNTYEIKDQLKASHCHWDPYFGWYFDHEVTEFPCVEISINDKIPCFDENGEESECTLGLYAEDGTLYMAPQGDIYRWIKSIRDSWNAKQAPDMEYFGNVGDKVQLSLKLVKVGGYETQFGYTSVYTFEDSENHQFVWKTGCGIDSDRGSMVTIKGSVKAHSEYRGIKQTELTRCKVIK